MDPSIEKIIGSVVQISEGNGPNYVSEYTFPTFGPAGRMRLMYSTETSGANEFQEMEIDPTFERKAAASAENVRFDRPSQAHNDDAMSMTREELNARLELVEAKADARMSRFEERIDQAISEMRRDRTDLKADIGELRTEQKTTRWTFVVAAVGSVIAIVGGIAAFNATLVSNMQSSFALGKDTMKDISEITSRIEKVQSDIKAQQDLQRAATLTPAPAPAPRKQ